MADLDEDQISQLLAELGRRGGLARAKRLSPARRKEIATKASKAAAKARTRKARKKRKTVKR
jgi:hypothetical protein